MFKTSVQDLLSWLTPEQEWAYQEWAYLSALNCPDYRFQAKFASDEMREVYADAAGAAAENQQLPPLEVPLRQAVLEDKAKERGLGASPRGLAESPLYVSASWRRLAALVLSASLSALLVWIAALSAPAAPALRQREEQRLRPAWDHKCDKHLAARSSDAGREVEARLCVDHAALRNVARSVVGQSLAFVVLGDWGRDGFCCQRDVALEMSRAAQQTAAAFVVNTGDSFYPLGLDASEDPQVRSSWRDVYLSQAGLRELPWLSVLGNHEYYSRSAAVLGLHRASPTPEWHMPARYYAWRASPDLHLVLLDTTPCLAIYETDAKAQDARDFLATTGRTPASYLREQLAFLRAELAKSRAAWKVVVGHHPVLSSSEHHGEDAGVLRRELSPLLQQLGVAAYINGHDHGLELHRPGGDSGPVYVTSGGGSQVRRDMAQRDEGLVFRYAASGGFLSVSLNATVLALTFIDDHGGLLYELLLRGPHTPAT